MRLFVTLALLAVASALPESLILSSLTKRDTDETNAGVAHVDLSPIQLEDTIPTNDETSPTAVKVAEDARSDVLEDVLPVPVKVSHSKHFQAGIGEVHIVDVPFEDPESMRKFYPEMNFIDISPMYVPEDVMQKIAEMDETNAFSYNSAEHNIDPVIVVDGPKNELNAEMHPVMVVESSSGEQSLYVDMPKNPESIKIVDLDLQNVPMVPQPVPKEYWRGPPQGHYSAMPKYFRDAPNDVLQTPYHSRYHVPTHHALN